MIDIAHRLKSAREAQGFATASECAERFGWNYATYAGHENGSRGIKIPMLTRYAAALKVDVAWLLTGVGSAKPHTPEKAQTLGFGDSDAAPFKPHNAAEGQMLLSTLSVLSPGARHTMIYKAQRDFAAFAIQSGDFLLIGTPAKPKEGDLVVANLHDADGKSAHTVIRQVLGDKLVPPAFGRIPAEEAMEKGIMGTVLAILRASGP